VINTNIDRLRFRPDIEGLRAVAILLVVAAHAGVPWLAGGFIGVDVFFVLSGYLITRLLADELTRTGSLQFARFYARRFRRLLPALLLMLCVTAVLGAQLAPVSQQGWQADAAAAAALWGSNLLFAFSRLDYFGSDASGNLFLHTWSLGVEEQFYLAWPLLLVVGYGAWRKSGPPSRLNLIQLLWLLAAISFAACVFITSIEPRQAFYLMPMRAWQFALGGLASLYFIDRTFADDGRPAASVHLLGWIGLALIIGSALALDSHTTYPGAWALLPTLGSWPCWSAARVVSVALADSAAGRDGRANTERMAAPVTGHVFAAVGVAVLALCRSPDPPQRKARPATATRHPWCPAADGLRHRCLVPMAGHGQ